MAPHGGLPKLVFCSHTRGQYTPPCVLVVYLAHLTHRTTPGRGCCSRHSPGSQGCERLKSMPRATMGHLLALSVPKSCCNTMPQPQSSKPNRHLEHFLWMQRGDTKNILHPGFGLGAVHSAHPYFCCEVLSAPSPHCHLYKAQGWWEGNALFCVAGNNREKSSATQNLRREEELKIAQFRSFPNS